MKKRVGILIPSSNSGGVFQYALSIAESLITYSNSFEYKVIYYDNDSERLKSFLKAEIKKEDFVAIPYSSPIFFKKILQFFSLFFGGDFFLIKNFYSILKNAGIDILIIPTPFTYTVPYKIPYIVSMPDLMHKYYPFSKDYGLKSILARNIVYKYYSKHSILNIVDSEQGAADLQKFLGGKKEKTRIIYYVPSGYIYGYKNMDSETIKKLLNKYNLPERFLFYPGNFWYQKNHAGLIKALNLINKNHRIKIPLVLVGHSKGCSEYEKVYKEMMDLVKNFKMEDQIYYLGYTGEKEIVALYKKAVALIAPPFQGPTTIPPLEAIVLGTPVVTVNLFEIPKQVENAGIFFDPSDIEDMADKVYKIWTNEKLRQGLIKNGKRVAKNYTLEAFSKKWEEVIKEALKIYEQKKY